MDFELLMNIIIAVFAVFGVYCLIKLVAESVFAPDYYAFALMCDDKTNPEEIACLINRARTVWRGRRARQTVVILRCGVRLPEDVESALRESGVRVYRVNNYRRIGRSDE